MAKKPMGSRLIEALTQVAEALESGDPASHPSVTVREVEVKDPPEYGPEDVAALRRKTRLSQAGFAKVLGSSVVTVQKWEQGTLNPNPMARRLMSLIAARPKTVTDGIITFRTKTGRAKVSS